MFFGDDTDRNTCADKVSETEINMMKLSPTSAFINLFFERTRIKSPFALSLKRTSGTDNMHI